MSSASELAADPRVRRGMATQLEARRQRLAAGERRLGWKLGFGSPAAMKALGTAGPLLGFLTDRSVLEIEREVSIGDCAHPVLEPELAVRLGTDVAPKGGVEAAGEAIGAVGPAFELADLDRRPDDVEAILAGNVFHRGVALGGDFEAGAPALERLRAVVDDGHAEPVAVEDPEAATGSIVALVRHVADLLGEFGESLVAGDVVICGSVVPPIAVAPGDKVWFGLEPLSEISIRFGE